MIKNANLYIGIVAVVVVVVGAAFFFSGQARTVSTSGPTTTQGGATQLAFEGNLSIQLTDPPIVPVGTQSLIIAYSGVDLHTVGASNSTGFVNFSINGTANLMNLSNVTQTIAVVRTSVNESFDAVRFIVSSANITIDNVTYNVTVPSGGVLARLNASVNGSAGSGVLFDFNPTVLQVYTGTNQSVFIMVPAAEAVTVGRTLLGSSALRVGASAAIQQGVKANLARHRANVSITNVTASVAGNATILSVTVKNNGNSSVLLSHVTVGGYMEAIPSFGSFAAADGGVISAAVQTVPAGAGSNMSTEGNMDTNLATGGLNFTGIPRFLHDTVLNASLNATVATDLHVQAAAGSPASTAVVARIDEALIFYRDFHDQLNFVVDANGSIEPLSGAVLTACPNALTQDNISTPVSCGQRKVGYVLQPNGTVTLKFDGVITMLNAAATVSPYANARETQTAVVSTVPRIAGAVVALIPNQTYNVMVGGNRGAQASASVVATGYASKYQPGLVTVSRVNLELDNTETGSTYNTTLGGFLSLTNSTVSYSIGGFGNYAGATAGRVPTRTLNVNVTGFSVNTQGFVLLNYTKEQPAMCPSCSYGSACPGCAGGTGRGYVLHIRTPTANYTGELSITEFFTAPRLNLTASGGGRLHGNRTATSTIPGDHVVTASGGSSTTVSTTISSNSTTTGAGGNVTVNAVVGVT